MFEPANKAALVEHYKDVHQRLTDVEPPPEPPPKFRSAVRRPLPPDEIPVVPVVCCLYLHGAWLAGPPDPPEITIKRIQIVVCRHYGVSLTDLLSDRRAAKIVLPRQVAMYLARKLTFKSLNELGRRFNRDHTTLISAINKVSRLIAENPSFAAEVESLRVKLDGSS